MSRQPRLVLPGQPQHVIQRGNNRDVIFIADEDYQFYLEKLAAACQRFECDLHAYVLMTNHVHLLMTPLTAQSISKVMQSLGRYYVQYFNYQGMVDHPSDYPWSSYACNAAGKADSMISPHALYLQLGENDDARQSNYRALFDAHLEPRELNEIQNATNKSWVLGSDRFKDRIEALAARQAQPKPRGGDRKSKKYRER